MTQVREGSATGKRTAMAIQIIEGVIGEIDSLTSDRKEGKSEEVAEK